MTPERNVMLVFPIFQAMYPRPFQNYAQMCVMAGRIHGYKFGTYAPERQPLVSAMNEVGRTILKDKSWDAVIVFDDDCFPPLDAIERLLVRCFDEGHKFVAGAGVMRNYPFTTTAARYYPEGVSVHWEKGKTWLAGFQWMDDIPNELVDVDFCGVPIAIIHRSCFERIRRPWFGDQDQHGERITHDVFFCNKLKAAGIPVKVDGGIRCDHLLDPPICSFENRGMLRDSIKAQRIAFGEEPEPQQESA